MIHKFLKWYSDGYYTLCAHRSHRLRLRCYRLFQSDGYCSQHNATCYFEHGKGIG